MKRSRVKYWSDSRLIKKLRALLGAPAPLSAGTVKEWREYHAACRRWNPFLNWLLDDFVDGIQNLLLWPKDALDSLTYWINKRFIEPTHLIDTGLERGVWHETDEKILHGAFNELVNFVECQKAAMATWMMSDNARLQRFVPWIHRVKLPYFISGLFPLRSQQLGIEYLLWEIGLKKNESWFGLHDGSTPAEIEYARNHPEWMKPTPQAEAALEQLELYVWWKFIRPMRPDPWDESGLTQFYLTRQDQRESLWDDLDDFQESAAHDDWKRAHDRHRNLELAHENEDTEMLIRLMRIRKSLWT